MMVFIKSRRKQLLLRSAVRIVFGAALSAGLSLAVTACGGEGSVASAPASLAPPSTTAPAARTTVPSATTSPVAAAATPAADPAAASPAGTWNVTYADDLTSILGQYTIIEEVGAYVMTTKTVLKIPDGGCSLPAGEEVGTFSGPGADGTYSGTERLYEQGTCAFAGTDATLDVTVSGSTMLLLVPGEQTVALTRTGTATAASPAASLPTATASSVGCIVPDEIGAGLNGHISAAAAEQDVAHSCPPVGYHVVTVLTVSGPAGTAPGELWKESPSAGTSAPPGSTVTLYFQP